MRGRRVTVYLGLGANLGDREANIRRALDLLREKVAILRVSSIYESPPVGFTEQRHFLNAACRVQTALSPAELLAFAKEIEVSMGRVGRFPNAPRPIDIDLLLYGQLVVSTPDVTVPHPRMAERAFVLLPMAEIAPKAKHPALGKSMGQLLKALGHHQVTLFRAADEGLTLRKAWMELSVAVRAELVEPLVELFTRHGKAQVAIEGPLGDAQEAPGAAPSFTVRGYLPANRPGWRRRARIEAGLALLGLIRSLPPLEGRLVDEEEWLAALRGHFTVLRVGKRLVIRPQWQKYQPRKGDVVITLDPGVAFGTGHHPTTRLCLEALERWVRPGMHVLDVGAGSGILAIAAAALGAERVLALDTDPQAVRAAGRNVRANGFQKRVQVVRGSLPASEPAIFHLVVANLSAKGVQSLLPQVRDALAADGLFIASGMLLEHREEFVKSLRTAGFRVVEEREANDWLAVAASLGKGSGERSAYPALWSKTTTRGLAGKDEDVTDSFGTRAMSAMPSSLRKGSTGSRGSDVSSVW